MKNQYKRKWNPNYDKYLVGDISDGLLLHEFAELSWSRKGQTIIAGEVSVRWPVFFKMFATAEDERQDLTVQLCSLTADAYQHAILKPARILHPF